MTDSDFDYRAFFHSAPGLYLVLDADLRVVTATESYCRATAMDWLAIAGTSYFDVLDAEIARQGHGESASLRASFARVLETKRRDAMPLQRFDFRSEDGSCEERYWSVMNVPILGRDGEVRWLVHRIREMTQTVRDRESVESQRRLMQEREDLIEALRAANRELADRERAPGDTARLARLDTIALMTSAIAHDMSQPLVSAMNYLSAFRRTVAAKGATDVPMSHVEKAEQQLKRAGEIVRGLRSYIAGEKTARRPESLSEMIRHAADLCEVVFRQRRTQIDFALDESLPATLVDRTQIVQVLVNIFNNAAEAMQDRPERKIHVRTWREGPNRRVDIADTGPGIMSELIEQLFKPFRSGKGAGLGLGLAICREIVQSHDGTLCARPNEPCGTIFSLTLPA